MGALSFSAPFILAALALLPAIWFLLRATPPTPARVRFPGFDILKRLGKTEETPERTPWPLLLLRLLIAAAAIIALAGPILNAPNEPASKAPLLIVVDDSWAAAPAWKLRRDALSAAATRAERGGRKTFLIATASADDEAPEPMTGAALREKAAALAPAAIRPDFKRAAAQIEAMSADIKDAEILWFSDGLAHDGADKLAEVLRRRGEIALHLDAAAPTLALLPPTSAAERKTFSVVKAGGGAWRGDVVAQARDGRELARTNVALGAGAASAEAQIELPLALQNDVAQVRLEGVSSAGAVQLIDARERRALIGVIASGEAGSDPLLDGAHYVRRALEPYAMFVIDSLENLIASDASVIVLDDVGTLRPSDVEALSAWVQKGGVLIRFAGPTIAKAAEDGAPPLLPVALRGGGRAFGGALTWETPQPLGAFNSDGPFAGLAAPADVLVRRQVLAEPGGETSERTWASLADGTPLVTGLRDGAGAIALFHITATPEWSDLPLSSLFIEMLRKLAFMSAIGPRAADGEAARLAPLRLLDGYGVLKPPPRDIAGASAEDLAAAPSRAVPPGLYGASEAPLAVNAIRRGDEFAAFDASGFSPRAYAGDKSVALAPPLIALTVFMLIIDGLAALHFAGKLRIAAFAALTLALVSAPDPSLAQPLAQPLDRPIGAKAEAGALETRLAFVRTGDPAADRIAEAGLAALSRVLAARTSLEPAAPVGVDVETDDLSVYPFLYWPMTPGAAAPSERALANIEAFMRFGGLIVFDTRDDERAIAGATTPEQLALKAVLSSIDLPPLAPTPRAHVLTRSFYLLPDLPGRMANNPVWVQSGEGPNDSVTPVIIGGRDWAGAWAADELGRPLYPMTAGGERAREIAYRAGVNMVMVALTGNYKSDQVHTPILLERLGRDE